MIESKLFDFIKRSINKMSYELTLIEMYTTMHCVIYLWHFQRSKNVQILNLENGAFFILVVDLSLHLRMNLKKPNFMYIQISWLKTIRCRMTRVVADIRYTVFLDANIKASNRPQVIRKINRMHKRATVSFEFFFFQINRFYVQCAVAILLFILCD